MGSGKGKGHGWMSQEEVFKFLESLGFRKVDDTVMRMTYRGWTVTVGASCIHNYNRITVSLPDGHSYCYETMYITFYRYEDDMPEKIMDLVNCLINLMEDRISNESEKYLIKNQYSFDI